MERIIKLMESIEPELRLKVIRKIREIVALCVPYYWQGKDFTFSTNPNLDRQVNAALVELSDEILADIDRHCTEAIEDNDDKDAVMLWLKGDRWGEDMTERVDKYSTHLKHAIEAYVAIGAAHHAGSTNVVNAIMTNMADLFSSEAFKKAAKQGDYKAGAISQGGYSYGKGTMKDPLAALLLLEQNSINTAYQYGTILKYRKDKRVIGYRVYRNSTYDCPQCDELCVGVHPLSEVVLPAHPRCVCGTTPVYADE